MSHYGTPGGAQPGDPGQQPPEPWPARQADDPYGQQSESWRREQTSPAASSTPHRTGPYDPGYQTEPYDPGYQTQPYGHGYRTGPVGGEPEPPADDRRVSRRALILFAALAAIALLVLAALAGTLYALRTPGEGAASGPTAAAPEAPAAEPTPAAEPQPVTPGAESAGDARFVKTGQCVKNESPTGRPKLAITACAAKTYEVIARFDGATNGEADAKAKCANVRNYTDWYYFNSELDTLDFVLCLKQR